jgi:hypothetical protein
MKRFSAGLDQTFRVRLATATVVLAGLLAAAYASDARGAFGDNFGVADINVAGAQSTPVFNDAEGPVTKAFWAGTCDTGLAPPPPAFVPPPGDPPYNSPLSNPPRTPIPDGIGGRPHNVWTPQTVIDGELPSETNPDEQQASRAAPRYPDQCTDWGGLEPYGNPARPNLWFVRPELLTPPVTNNERETYDRTPKWRLAPVTQAGAHPDGSTTMWFQRIGPDGEPPHSPGFIEGSVDNIYAKLPAGFVGNPTAVPKCTAEQFAIKPVECPPESQVGVLHLFLVAPGASGATYAGSTEELLPVYNLEPRHGKVAEFGITYVSNEDAVTARIVAKARTNGDFGVDAFVSQLPAALPVLAQAVTLWGVPWAAEHDMWRSPTAWRPSPFLTGEMPVTGLLPADRVSYKRSWGPIKPFLSNPSECSGQNLFTQIMTDSYENPGGFTAEGDPDLSPPTGWKFYDSAAPPVTGCEKVPFDASFDPQPSSTVADAPSGLSVDVTIPQNNTPRDINGDPLPVPGESATQPEIDQYVADAMSYWRSDEGLATSQLKKTVVTLPPGVVVNPSGATGLAGCTDAQMGVVQQGSPPLFNNDDPFDGQGLDCPKGSRIGTVEVDTPLLDEPLTGDVVLGMPEKVDHDNNPATPPKLDPESGKMFRLFIVARDKDRGLVAKISGSSVADEETGQQTATFDQNPRVPFDNLHLELKGGQRGLLALPQDCGNPGWSSSFSPWSTAHGVDQPVLDNGTFTIDQRCSQPFTPTLDAGMSPRQGGGSGTFTLSFARQDGEQWFRGLSGQVPQGLLANVGSVTLCTNAQASANACPLASKIGTVDGSAGSGTPFVLEKKGSIYLTEGYKGAPYGLAVSVPVEAGPFRGDLAPDPIVVRQALRVDPTTAQVTAESDPLPTIHFGIPLRVRSVIAKIDRPGFMRNPTDCSPKQIKATFTSNKGKVANVAEYFQAAGCGNLPFRPKLSMAFTGSRKQARYLGHPGINATLTQPPGQAGIKATTVRLPKAIVLDPDRVADTSKQCEYQPSLVGNCPASSIIGTAKAVSPLLKRPLEGPIYFAKNRRINSFGRSVPTLPSIVVALRGEIAVNVRGNSDAIPGKALISTFPTVPDAPVSRFELKLKGGKTGILIVSRDSKTGRKLNLCGKQIAEVDMDGHNGKIRDFNVRMKTPCKKAKKGKKKKSRKRSKKRR